MKPVDASIWRRVPGYESDESDSEDAEEAELAARSAECLEEVKAALGRRWIPRSPIRFEPAPMPRAGAFHFEKGVPPPRNSLGTAKSPPQVRIENADNMAPLVRETFFKNGVVETRGTGWCIQWSSNWMRDIVYQRLEKHQRINHFPHSTEMTRKDRLWVHFNCMSKQFGPEVYDFVPETYVLPDQMEDFLQAYQQHADYIWIVKPHASSRGRGIYVLRKLEDLPAKEVMVVSRYIHNPMLIQHLKFDLRVYVLVTSFEPLQAYMYREGLTRFACKPYSTKEEHMQDVYSHLTNYSINKKSKQFTENSEVQADNVGHKWSLSALNKHLLCVGVDVSLMWARIMDLVVKTLLSVESSISRKARDLMPESSNCFELYGFDILVDEDLKPWLVEVNLSPSMQAESPLDWEIKTSLLSNTLNLVGVYHVDRTAEFQGKMKRLRSNSRELNATAAAPAPSAAASDSSYPLPLHELSEAQLMALAQALQEGTRCQNFIRLYPTKATVDRYGPLTDALMMRTKADMRNPHSVRISLTQLLAAMLFGRLPKPPASTRSRSSPPANVSVMGRAGGQHEDALGKAEARSRSRHADAQQALVRTFEQAVICLGERIGGCVVLMEYLIRIRDICNFLAPGERAKLSKSDGYRQLLAFQRQLEELMPTNSGAPPDSAANADVGASGDVVADLAETCRQRLVPLIRTAWSSEEVCESSASPHLDTRRCSLQNLLPPSVLDSSAGRLAVQALPSLTAIDLERMLSGPHCLPEHKALLRSFVDAADTSPVRAASCDRIEKRAHEVPRRGPLSEILWAAKPSAPSQVRRPKTPDRFGVARVGRADAKLAVVAPRPPVAPVMPQRRMESPKEMAERLLRQPSVSMRAQTPLRLGQKSRSTPLLPGLGFERAATPQLLAGTAPSPNGFSTSDRGPAMAATSPILAAKPPPMPRPFILPSSHLKFDIEL